jgi:isopentenyldiphosphate isomerase
LKFRYNARYKNIGSENEICAVTVVDGADDNRIAPDRNEISDVRVVAMKDLLNEVERGRADYTPWLILALEHLKRWGASLSLPCCK